jgi:putative ABC transport system ATP-binding protein
MDDYSVKVEGLSKSFQQGPTLVKALENVSFTLEKGDFVAVMGASGSGKSTLLHLLAGLTETDSGSIEIAGQDTSTLGNKELTLFRRRHIGLIFQAFNLVSTLSAESNITLPKLLDRQSIDENEINTLLERLELSDRRNHRPDSMSGGEQQRAAIGRALINKPFLILADEPTGSLDSVTSRKICKLLKDVAEQSHSTVIMVTHEASVALWAKKVMVMRDGSILDSFSTEGMKDPRDLEERYQEVLDKAAVTEEVM